MQIDEITNKDLTEIKIFQDKQFLHETVTDSLIALFKSLDEVEQTTLRALINVRYAMSVRQLRRVIAKILSSGTKSPIHSYRKIGSVDVDLPEGSNFENLPEPKFEEKVSELNRKHPELNIPSYYKVKNVLKELNNMNLALSKPTKFRKADELWYINPKFFKIFLYVVKGLEAKEKPSYVDNLAYIQLTGRELK